MRQILFAMLAVAFSVSVCEARWVRQRHCYVQQYAQPAATEAVVSAPAPAPSATTDTQTAAQPGQQYQSFQHDTSANPGIAPRVNTPSSSKSKRSEFSADRKIRGL